MIDPDPYTTLPDAALLDLAQKNWNPSVRREAQRELAQRRANRRCMRGIEMDRLRRMLAIPNAYRGQRRKLRTRLNTLEWEDKEERDDA